MRQECQTARLVYREIRYWHQVRIFLVAWHAVAPSLGCHDLTLRIFTLKLNACKRCSPMKAFRFYGTPQRLANEALILRPTFSARVCLATKGKLESSPIWFESLDSPAPQLVPLRQLPGAPWRSWSGIMRGMYFVGDQHDFML